MPSRVGLAEFGEERTVMGAHDIFVEEPEDDAMKFGVGIFLVMFQSEGAGDDFAPGIGFALGLLVAGFEGSQLGIELLAFFAEEF